MRRLLKSEIRKIALIFILCSSISLQAADRIVHFYFDFVIGLSADLNHYDSVVYSLGNEMVDGGIYTHPMGLVAARLLNHFLGTPMNITTDGGFVKNGVAIATINHPLVYTILEEAIRTNNKMMIGAIRHRLIDTFFHSGWSSLLGHGEGGHRPDMPHEELYKAQACFQAIMELTFYLRDMTEGEASTTNMKKILSSMTSEKLKALHDVAGTKDIDQLVQYMRKKPGVYAEVLWYNEDIIKAFSIKIENSYQYRSLAFEELFKSMQKEGIVNLNESEFKKLKELFSDLKTRRDLSPQDAFRIAIYRTYQVITNTQTDVSNRINFPPEMLEKLRLERLNGYTERAGLLARVQLDQMKNFNSIKLLVADIKDLKNELGGEWIQSNKLSLEQNDKLNKISGNIISWDQVIDMESFEPRSAEDIRVGDIPDLRDVEAFRKYIYDNKPDVLDKFVEKMERLSEIKLNFLARLKAVAELASLASIEAMKDIIANARITTTQHTNFEKDSLLHACFSSKCREQSAKIAIAKLFGIQLDLGKLGTLGFKELISEYISEVIREGKHKMNAEARLQYENEKAKLEQAVREYLLEIGLAELVNGKIVTPLDDVKSKDLVSVKPQFTFKGLRQWFSFTRSELAGLIYRFDIPFIGNFRSNEIHRRAQKGAEFKTYYTRFLNYLYGDGAPLSEEEKARYSLSQLKKGSPELLNREGFIKITPNGNNVNFGSMRCADILN